MHELSEKKLQLEQQCKKGQKEECVTERGR